MCFSDDQVFGRNYKCSRNIAFFFEEKSLVKPIFKIRSDQGVGCYRPITLVAILSKIMGEKENP
jgi:hypothetical protein